MPKWIKPGDLSSRVESLIDKLLEYLPEKTKINWQNTVAAQWKGDGFVPVRCVISSIRLSDILGYEVQKKKLLENTRQFLAGYPANNVLLWGARGTGKSSLIQALLNELAHEGLRVIEVEKRALKALPDIVGEIQSEPYRFILYCDDLSFQEEDDHYKELKSALEGSVFSGQRDGSNALIYATSNRRHLVPEYRAENDAVEARGGQIHLGDQIEEKLSLSDRFGIWLSFYPIAQDEYLKIVEHWIKQLIEHYKLEREAADENNIKGGAANKDSEIWGEFAQKEALKWTLEKGNRSGRTAYQFAMHWVGQYALRSTR